MTIAECLVWTEKIIAIVIGLQTIEILSLRPAFGAKGIWNDSFVSLDYKTLPVAVAGLFRWLFKTTQFQVLLFFQMSLVAQLLISNSPIALILLFLTNQLVSIRCRGNFNGGSDTMTSIVLFCTMIAQSFPDSPLTQKACIWYIAIQLVFSYVIAGWAKIRQSSWRNGQALSDYLQFSAYQVPAFFHKLALKSQVMKWSARSLLFFELSYPLAVTGPRWAGFYLSLGFLFHLGNFWVFGLNRFVFAWLAAYPALIYCVL